MILFLGIAVVDHMKYLDMRKSKMLFLKWLETISNMWKF